MDEDIIEELDSIPNLELLNLYYDIKHIIEDKEIGEEVIFEEIKYIGKDSSSGEKIQYDRLTLYLEDKGYNRESISKKVLDLIKVGKIDYAQSWTSIHPIYEGKEYVEIGFIYFPEEKYKSDYLKEMIQKVREKQKLEREKEKLYELPMEELLDIQELVMVILNGKEIDTDTISYAIKHLCNVYHDRPWIRYTALTLFLEKAGFRRESISRELINMVRKGVFKFSSDWPIRGKHTKKNPIVPVYEGKQYSLVNIYCKKN